MNSSRQRSNRQPSKAVSSVAAKRRTKNKGGRPKASEAAAKAERLRAVAMEVFVEKGFELASLSEIARRAGASKDTLYAQYADKAGLFIAAMTTHLEGAFLPFRRLTEANGTPERTLKQFSFEAISSILGPHQDFVHLIFAESQRFPELSKYFWEQSNLRAYAELAAYLRLCIRRGELRDDDPNGMARDLIALLGFDATVKSMLNVERSMIASRRRRIANRTVNRFLRMYGVNKHAAKNRNEDHLSLS